MPSRPTGSLIVIKTYTTYPKCSLCKDLVSKYAIHQRVGSTSLLNIVFLTTKHRWAWKLRFIGTRADLQSSKIG